MTENNNMKNNENSIEENKLFYSDSNQRQIEKAINEVKTGKVVNKTIEELEKSDNYNS